MSYPDPDLNYIGRAVRIDEADLSHVYLIERSRAIELTTPDTPPRPPEPPIRPVGPKPPIGPTPPRPAATSKKRTRYILLATVNKQKAFRVFGAINNWPTDRTI